MVIGTERRKGGGQFGVAVVVQARGVSVLELGYFHFEGLNWDFLYRGIVERGCGQTRTKSEV